MKKKRDIRSEIKKILRPEKVKKVSDKNAESQKIEYPEQNAEVYKDTKAVSKKKTAIEELTEVQESCNKADITEETEKKSEDNVQLQIENNIKLSIKKSVKQSAVKNTSNEIHIQIKPEKNISFLLKKRAYADFSKIILNKYGLERMNITFSKLIFRQRQMQLNDGKLGSNTHSDTILNNYTNHYSIDKPVYKLITQSIVSTNTKSNKEVKVPFYILRNSQSDSHENSDNELEYDKDALVLLPKTSLDGGQTHRNANNETSGNSFVHNTSNINYYGKTSIIHNVQEKDTEPQNSSILIDRVNRITKVITRSDSLLLRTQVANKEIRNIDSRLLTKNNLYVLSNLNKATILHLDNNQQSKLSASIPETSRTNLDKQELSNRTSIGSNKSTINSDNIDRIHGNNDKNQKTSIDGDNNNLTFAKTNADKDLNEKSFVNNANISKYSNTRLYKSATTNLIINRIANGKANGSSNINIKNNIMSNRINNGVLNTTINNISKGIINKNTNIITIKGLNRLDKAEKLSPQLSLKISNGSDEEIRGKLESQQVDSEEKVRDRLRNKSEDKKDSDIILYTTLKQRIITPTTTKLQTNSLAKTDGEISRLVKIASNDQYQQNDEKQDVSNKNVYKEKTKLIPAEFNQSIGIPNIKNQMFEDSNLTLYIPQKKETPKSKIKEYKDVIEGDEQVITRTVTSSKRKIKYEEIEIEEVNRIAERALKILEKRIAIQKDRRGLI